MVLTHVGGAKVKIIGLTSEEGQKLNGTEGVIDHWSEERGRFATSLPGGSRMIKKENLEVLEAPAETIFQDEEAMMKQLVTMGMPPDMLKNLTPEQKKQMLEMTQRQDIIQRAKAREGVVVRPTEFKEAAGGLYSWRDLSESVELEVPCDAKEKKDVTVTIGEQFFVIATVGGGTIVQGTLFQKVSVEGCTWEFGEGAQAGKLMVTLAKAERMRWLMVTR
jgi:hypothetical protein